MDIVVERLLEAIQARDWDRVRLLLHPYLRWTNVCGTALRGRKAVMAYLVDAPVAATPNAYELRDGQVYRWREEQAAHGTSSE